MKVSRLDGLDLLHADGGVGPYWTQFRIGLEGRVDDVDEISCSMSIAQARAQLAPQLIGAGAAGVSLGWRGFSARRSSLARDHAPIERLAILERRASIPSRRPSRATRPREMTGIVRRSTGSKRVFEVRSSEALAASRHGLGL